MKKFYAIEYDTNYGTATFDGEYESFSAFVAEADKAGRETGVLRSSESVMDCDYVLDGASSGEIESVTGTGKLSKEHRKLIIGH